ncbi:GntR family transcriptional regulator [Paremcibacter congregatus]|uniref:GntR family transcriptional regulator n=1 Tax=Paremcibacter congregatus TaxID=2043170 RepID=A0A2G4YT71_9PROT|nr:GntR family transcriptional regulator [Paremcibacter congregatus]PHZ85542.1 GntR family transcriptional regulator [Paremcibacter congregatus]QDE26502.1 GntR family transcriptional regulator [Paremcibacter congregatus]
MATQWKNDQPIYLQLKEQILAMIMDGVLTEGEALPSVRKVAVDYQINPITASKAYAELVDEGLVEKRRGLGMFILEGAKKNLLKAEQEKFLTEEWPEIIKRISRLGLDPKELVKASENNTSH